MKRALVSFWPLAAALVVAMVPCAAHAQDTQTCEITVGVDGPSALGALELHVDYSGAGGQFVGDGEEVQCVALAPGAYSGARNDAGAEDLELGMISASGVPLPQDFFRCSFEATGGAPVAGDFGVAVSDALDPELQPVPAAGSISGIVCDGDAECGNGIIEGAEECDDGEATLTCEEDCELTRNTQRCGIAFRVTGQGPIGGVQFHVNYAGSNGEFEGTGVDVACTEALESALTAVEDLDDDEELRVALISAGGLDLPVDLWECTFVTNAVLLQLESFVFENVIATDENLGSVAVGVTAISNSCIYGPYCGDGTMDPGEGCDDGNGVNTDACTNACTVAVCGDGAVRTGVEQCDDGNSTTGDCCANNCTFESAVTVCRAASGVCDLAENCTGGAGTCPADLKKTTACRASAGVCDPAEVCDGVANACPADVLGTGVCRASGGVCDLTETCTGSGAACPVDAFQPSGTACTNDSNTCTTDQCNGAGTCGHLANSLACDDGLFCNGADTCSAGTCSQHAGNVCPGADGDGDCSETCSESTDNCNGNDPDTSACNDGNSSTTNDQCLSGLCVGGTSSGVCGDADANGSVNTSDALRILRKSVGQSVTCPLFRCDTDDNGATQSSDALRVLKKAVGQAVALDCPPEPV